MRSIRAMSVVVALIGCGALVGCTAISIEPSCPNGLRVGESGSVSANEINPGAIASYLWEAFPEGIGQFANPSSANTTFEALTEGVAIIRLTASDGLFQVVSQCTTTIDGFLGVAVMLQADPIVAVVGDEVTLTCTDDGTVESIALAIAQTDGGNVDLVTSSSGVATFVPTQIGDLTFRCVGESGTGSQTSPVTIIVSVSLRPDDSGNNNTNENVNDNAPANDNSAANENVNDNASDNTNDNAAANQNDNTNDNGGRRGGRNIPF